MTRGGPATRGPLKVGDRVRVKEPHRYATIEGEVTEVEDVGHMRVIIKTKLNRFIRVRLKTIELIEAAPVKEEP